MKAILRQPIVIVFAMIIGIYLGTLIQEGIDARQEDGNIVTDIVYKTETIYIQNNTQIDCVDELSTRWTQTDLEREEINKSLGGN